MALKGSLRPAEILRSHRVSPSSLTQTASFLWASPATLEKAEKSSTASEKAKIRCLSDWEESSVLANYSQLWLTCCDVKSWSFCMAQHMWEKKRERRLCTRNQEKHWEPHVCRQASLAGLGLLSAPHGPGGDTGGPLRLRSFKRKSWRGGKTQQLVVLIKKKKKKENPGTSRQEGNISLRNHQNSPTVRPPSTSMKWLMWEMIDNFPPCGQDRQKSVPILQSREIMSQQSPLLINSGGNNRPSQKALDNAWFLFFKELAGIWPEEENDVYSRSVRTYIRKGVQ